MTIGLDELQLAARNHGLPLEALRWDVTPVGLHYLLIHYDIPAVDPATWRLELGGRVERPAVARPRRPARPCADGARLDDGVRRQRPRPDGAARDQPAVAARGGRHRPLGRRRARRPPRRGRTARRRRRCRLHGTRRRDRGRSRAALRALAAARRGEVGRPAARARPERRAAAAAARLPAPARRPGLVRDDEREVAGADRGRRRALRRLPADDELPLPPRRGRRGRPGRPHGAAGADGPARRAGLPHARAVPPRRGRRLSRAGPGRDMAPSSASSSPATAAAPGTTQRSTRSSVVGPGGAGRTRGSRPHPGTTSSPAAQPTPRGTSSRSCRNGTSAATRTTPCSACP